MRKQFSERARLPVYLESSDLERLSERAKRNGKKAVEYARDLILAHLNDGPAPENLRRVPAVPVVERSTGAPLGTSADAGQQRDSSTHRQTSRRTRQSAKAEAAYNRSEKPKLCRHGIYADACKTCKEIDG